MKVNALVEGYLESVLMPVLLAQIGRSDIEPVIRDARGGPNFWKEAKRYNEAAGHTLVLGLADVEQATCAGGLMVANLPKKSAAFHLRLAVRMLESWLIADRIAIASFLGVSQARIPRDPDQVAHPKRLLVTLARGSSKRAIREALVPDDSGGIVGPDYVATMASYIASHWNVERARAESPSLNRACDRWAAI